MLMPLWCIARTLLSNSMCFGCELPLYAQRTLGGICWYIDASRISYGLQDEFLQILASLLFVKLKLNNPEQKSCISGNSISKRLCSPLAEIYLSSSLLDKKLPIIISLLVFNGSRKALAIYLDTFTLISLSSNISSVKSVIDISIGVKEVVFIFSLMNSTGISLQQCLGQVIISGIVCVA